jgi:hypothetical protein
MHRNRANAAQQREERESLLTGSEHEKPQVLPTPPSSGNSGFLNFRREKRKTSNVVAKAHPDADDVERASLLGGDKKLRPPKNAFRIASQKRRQRQAQLNPPWTLSRLMKYLALMLISCTMTFWLLRKESKEVHWNEYKGILEPDGSKETRCFVSVDDGFQWSTILFSLMLIMIFVCTT